MIFFKKYFVSIVFILLCFIIIIGIILNIKVFNKEINSKQDIKTSKTKKKIDFFQPKFKTTQANFDKITNYVLTENNDKNLLPDKISLEEKEIINKIKNNFQFYLKLLGIEGQWVINEKRKIKHFQNQREPIQYQILLLIKKLDELETQFNDKKKEVKQIKIQIKQTIDQTQKLRLYEKLFKLRDEKIKLVNQISETKFDIQDLENTYKTLTNKISRAEHLRNHYQETYDQGIEESQKDVKSSLQNIYGIIP